MRNILNKEVILWDFDGVIVDSMEVREMGFKKVLRDYPQEQVEKLLKYHQENGGLSRYVKFRYFLEEFRNEQDIDDEVTKMAEEYSGIMRKHLNSDSYKISDTVNFIEKYHSGIDMHIVSGSDGEELRFLCKNLDLQKYFVSIEGSPTPKTELVEKILLEYKYEKQMVGLIGDSINDFEAAKKNGIDFFGYNNIKLKEKGEAYIHSFKNILAAEK